MSQRERFQMKRKKQHRARIKRLLAAILVLIIGTCGIFFSSAFASAHGNASEAPVSYKYFKSIEIVDGDSLWSLADTYMSEEYESKEEYIRDVVQINHLDSTAIYDSQKLIVPYYDTVFRK